MHPVDASLIRWMNERLDEVPAMGPELKKKYGIKEEKNDAPSKPSPSSVSEEQQA